MLLDSFCGVFDRYQDSWYEVVMSYGDLPGNVLQW